MNFIALIVKNRVRFFFSHQQKKKYFFRIQQEKQHQQLTVLPSQYPKNLNDNAPVIRRGRPVRYITPKHQIPQQKFVQNSELIVAEKYNGKWVSPQNSYALNIGLIGPVNSGKSELMGKIIGRKISAVSPKANTTTQTIQSYKSFQIESEQGLRNVQLKFYDTAGMMYKKTGFISKGWKVLSQIDFSLLVIDSTKRFDEMTKQSIKRLQSHRNYENFMKALVLNKIDLVDNRRKFHSLISQVEKYGKFDKIFYVSALTGYGVQDIQNYMIKMAKKRQWQQPKQALTNLTQIQIYEQMMKECLYHRSYKQVPYVVRIQCIQAALKSDGMQQIRFKFTVESENQQRMIIGKEGRNIKWMMDRFKVYYAQTYKKPVQVNVEVKIKKKTRQNQFLSEDTTFDAQTQKKFELQKIAIVQQYLYDQGKFKKENMLEWKGMFASGQENISKEKTPLLSDSNQLNKSVKKISQKRALKPKRSLKNHSRVLKKRR